MKWREGLSDPAPWHALIFSAIMWLIILAVVALVMTLASWGS